MRKMRIFYMLVVILLTLGLTISALASQPAQNPPPPTTSTTSTTSDVKQPEPEGTTSTEGSGINAIATYSFTPSSGTYTEITGGTVYGTSSNDDTSFNAVNIGFTFVYDGVGYSQISIQSNGFIAMGATVISSYTPLSTGTSNNVASALGTDLQGNGTTSTLRAELLGSAPNRIFVVQWKDYKYYGSGGTGDIYNFQIRLNETTQQVEIVYGEFTKNATSRTPEVGLRGASNADFNNRMTDTTHFWANSLAGIANTSTMALNTTTLPASGQTYTWAPPTVPNLDGSFKAAPAYVLEDQQITYAVHIVNVGTGAANNATLVDPIPSGTTYVDLSVDCTSGTCSYDSINNQILWNGTVAIGSSEIITFSVDVSDLDCGTTVINTATIDDPGIPVHPVIRTATTQVVYVIPAVVESFNILPFPPAGWGQTYLVGTYNWDRQTTGTFPTIAPHSGAAMARWNSYNFSSGNSTRLYSPVFTVSAGDWLTFYMSHDTGYSGSADSITPQISTDGGTTWTDLGAPILRYNAAYTTPGWGEHKYDLSAYAGQTNVLIGLVAISQYGNNIFIDDITVAPPWFPCATLTIGPDQTGSSCASSTIRYPLTVQNITPLTDTVDITSLGATWPTSVIPDVVILGPAQSTVVTVTVNIPWDAVPLSSDTAIIQAVGEDSGLSDTASITTSVKPFTGMADDWLNVATGSEPSLFWGHSYYYNGDICVLGGLTGSTPALTGAHNCYNISTATWSTRQTIPTPVFAGAYGLIGDKFYIAGGFIDSAFNGTNLLQIYDITSDTWSTGTAMSTARGGAGGGVVNGLLYSAGGSPTGSFPVDCPTYEYDPIADTWATLASCPLQGGYGFDLGGSIGSDYWGLLFVGGHFGAYSGWFAYDPGLDTWATLVNLPGGIHKTPLFEENPTTGQIYMIGGLVGWVGTNTTYEYDPLSNTWTLLPLVNLNTAQGGSAGPAYGSFGDPTTEGFWTVGGTVGSGSIAPAPFELWEYGTLCTVPEPGIEVNMPVLEQTLLPDQIATLSGQICNVGNAPLDWTMVEVPGLQYSVELALPAGQVPVEGMVVAGGPARAESSYNLTRRAGVETPPDVLLVVADGATVIQGLLQAYGDLGAVDVFDAQNATPTLAELQTYDVVLTWTNFNYGDPVGMGNVLADYVDGGGKVIDLMFAMGTHGWQMGGRFMDENYTAMNGTSLNFSNICLGTYDTGHPIMQGVTDVCEFYRTNGTYLTPGSSEIAQWSDGLTFVAAKDNQTVVSINGYVGDDFLWTGQMPDVVHNAILWLAVPAFDIPWLSEDPTSGTLQSGECTDVVVTFDSMGLTPGIYTGGLDVNSNDPDEPTVNLPVTLEVILGAPDIVVEPSELDATLSPGEMETLPMTITNVGASDLLWAIFEGNPNPAWSDNFDSYPTNSQMHGQGGWKGWANNPGAGAFTTDDQARSAPNSVAILLASDLVHEYAGYTSGIWTYSAWQYIPTDFSGLTYFLLLNSYDDGGVNLNWSTQVGFDSTTGLLSNEGPDGGTLPMITGQWVEIHVEIDLNNNTQSFYYGGDLLFSGSWTEGMSGGGVLNIAAVDLFANGSSVVYYDDISLGELVDLPWLSTIPPDGTTLPGESSPVDVLFDATGMTPGVYTATLYVASNDPDEPLVTVPVTMNVVAPPDIEVIPPSLMASQFPDQITIQTIHINNLGSLDLVWNIFENQDCTPGDVPWLSENPISGTTPGGGSSPVDATFDSTGMAPGDYFGDLCIESNDPDEPSVIVPVTMTVNALALELNKTVGTQAGVCAPNDTITVPPGTTVYYCYNATNTGDVALNTHDLFDDVLGQLFTGRVIPLDPGDSTEYITSTVVTTDTTNTATWTAWADETHSTEASDTATVTVFPVTPLESDLAVTKSDNADPVRVGNTITYTLVVTNYGPDAATGVILTDTLPSIVTFVSAAGCTQAAGVVTCVIGDLAVDASTTRLIIVTATAVGTATDTAEVSSANTDPDPLNNIATEDTEIIPAMFFFYLPIINKN